MGITDGVWYLFKDYLSGRSQCTAIDGISSSFLPVISGVPQGSILGPLLFVVYVNDLPLCTSSCSPLMFADDCKCLASINSASDSQLFQKDLDSLYNWSVSWKLPFNLSKCKFMQIAPHSKTAFTVYDYFLNDVKVNSVSQHRDLGVIFSSDFTWSYHYSDIIFKAYKTLFFIRRTISSHHSTHIKLTLYISLIRPRLSYCSQVWRPHHQKDIKAFERVQRRCTKFILNNYTSSYKDRLVSLHLLPLSLWFEFMDITFLISCIKYPQEHFNIFNYVQFVASKTRHSSCFKLKCLLPQSTSNHLNFIYFNRVVKLWNALPVIDPELSISTLKCNLRSYFWQYFLNNFNSDQPCTWHYTCPCNTCFSQPSPQNYSNLPGCQ